MSDFSTISFDHEFQLLPVEAKLIYYFQSKDFPDDSSLSCCINGKVNKDGLFIRSDNNCWNPNLNGWVILKGEFSTLKMFAHFKMGRVIELSVDNGSVDDRILIISTQGADDSPNSWLPID